MNRDFWFRRERWPFDPKGFVFLARAVEEIGRAIHGNEWSGMEFRTDLPEVLGRTMSTRAGDRVYAWNLLRQFRKDIELSPVQSGGKYTPPDAPLTDEQWDIAREISKGLNEAALPAFRRRRTVEFEIARCCEAGELISAYRPERGGALQGIPAAWWNTERNHNRFFMCQLKPSDPFGIGVAGENYAWIFLTRESLDRWLALQPNQPIEGIQGHLSPYLRLMLGVSRRLEITAENQPKKEVVITALRDAWTGRPLSNKLIETMATLLREPESQLGRARRKE